MQELKNKIAGIQMHVFNDRKESKTIPNLVHLILLPILLTIFKPNSIYGLDSDNYEKLRLKNTNTLNFVRNYTPLFNQDSYAEQLLNHIMSL